MTHSPGTHLGGVRTIDDLRQRCYVDEHGCWHMRTAHGRPHPQRPGHTLRVWLHGRGSISATRAAWELSRGRPVPPTRKAVRRCTSHDCVAPEHIVAVTDGAHKRLLHTAGLFVTPARRAQLASIMHAKRKLSPEQVRYVMLSAQSAPLVAAELGVTVNVIWRIRRGLSYRDVLRLPV